MAKITGLGGLFYKVRDPAATRAWYEEKLGIGGEWGAHFRLSDGGPEGYNLLSPFKADSTGCSRT
jgi:catechol 2,3-dioxygenase-like lactoylglutathione lyase family enzyme